MEITKEEYITLDNGEEAYKVMVVCPSGKHYYAAVRTKDYPNHKERAIALLTRTVERYENENTSLVP